MDQANPIHAIIAGDIFFETIINKNNEISLNKPGGSALYTAAGFCLWGKRAGILSKISEDKPDAWMQAYQDRGCDTTGIKKVLGALDQVYFYAVTDGGQVITENPQKYFFAQGQPLPKFLLGYEPPQRSMEINRTILPSSVSLDDIPEDYLRLNHLLVAPTDLYTHSMLPPFYRSKTGGRILFCSSESFMQPAYWYEFPPLIRGSAVFLTTEKQLTRLFLGKTADRWEMMEFVADCGVEIVVAYSDGQKHFLYDNAAHLKYEIPCYEPVMVDPVGAYPTYCGAFCSGYITHFDPVESALMGSVAAGIKHEGTGPLYTLQALPDLARVRLEQLREHIRSV